MIAVIHKDNVVHFFIADLISVEGQNVIGKSAAANGVTQDILVVDGFTHSGDETGQFITNGSLTIRSGDVIDPDAFMDVKNSLPLTQTQIDKNRLDDMEMMLADIAMGGL